MARLGARISLRSPEGKGKGKAPYRSDGKTPVLFDRFTPGYVAKRLQAAMTLEGLIADGKTGVMSGSGTFDYGAMKPHDLFRNRDVGLLKLKAAVGIVEKETPLKPEG